MTKTTVRTAPIDPARVVRSYHGRCGCMCGCRGNYGEPGDLRTKRIIKRMASAIEAGLAMEHSGLDGETVVFVENDSTQTVLYVREA